MPNIELCMGQIIFIKLAQKILKLEKALRPAAVMSKPDNAL